MSWREVLWRIARELQQAMWKITHSGKNVPIIRNRDDGFAISPIQMASGDLTSRSVDNCTIAANEVLDGSWRVFGVPVPHVNGAPQWNRDPRFGVLARLEFGPSLDYRNEKLVGDIKYLWEPNRHLQLVTLAQAYQTTGDKRFGDGIERFLNSWLDDCPYLMGPNWSSSLELAIRLINWSLLWRILNSGGSFRLIQ